MIWALWDGKHGDAGTGFGTWRSSPARILEWSTAQRCCLLSSHSLPLNLLSCAHCYLLQLWERASDAGGLQNGRKETRMMVENEEVHRVQQQLLLSAAGGTMHLLHLLRPHPTQLRLPDRILRFISIPWRSLSCIHARWPERPALASLSSGPRGPTQQLVQPASYQSLQQLQRGRGDSSSACSSEVSAIGGLWCPGACFDVTGVASSFMFVRRVQRCRLHGPCASPRALRAAPPRCPLNPSMRARAPFTSHTQASGAASQQLPPRPTSSSSQSRTLRKSSMRWVNPVRVGLGRQPALQRPHVLTSLLHQNAELNTSAPSPP